ncbi:MAG: hypothetical protein WEE89_19820 [Gemmatimonadota bacterium]
MVSANGVGLTRLREGTELVRIGEPLRPESAAWRYGDQFGRRRNCQILMAGGGLGALGVLLASGVGAGLSVAVFGGLIVNAVNTIVHGNPEKVVARMRTDNAGTVAMRSPARG